MLRLLGRTRGKDRKYVLCKRAADFLSPAFDSRGTRRVCTRASVKGR